MDDGGAKGDAAVRQSLFSWGFSVDEIKRAQGADENFNLIVKCLEDVADPDASMLFKASPAAKDYWLNREE